MIFSSRDKVFRYTTSIELERVIVETIFLSQYARHARRGKE